MLSIRSGNLLRTQRCRLSRQPWHAVAASRSKPRWSHVASRGKHARAHTRRANHFPPLRKIRLAIGCFRMKINFSLRHGLLCFLSDDPPPTAQSLVAKVEKTVCLRWRSNLTQGSSEPLKMGSGQTLTQHTATERQHLASLELSRKD